MNRGLLIKPQGPCKLEAYVDSDFAGDRDMRRSITGYVLYFYGRAIAWKSKQQDGVTLSSSEAEYYAISEVTKELLLVKQILDFLEIEHELPMTIHADNNGAINLANNNISGTKTKHVDMRIHFVRDLIQEEPRILETRFVRSERNQADTITKNTKNETFWKHTKDTCHMMIRYSKSKREDVKE
ncbi:hypothetical protein IV203_033039 [Nitzschia inconspicua]|uniref:Uncharacterized protein n=1 Tax=Nitzschia inconspicua TaxID=303405 RepID=A0A9K3PFH6_9STRA|nr:hypothetical protein IV203_033039 [Nitzschia inconspicua]